MRPPLDPTLYLVTDTVLCRPRPVADVVRAAVAGGVTAVQVRDKEAAPADLLELTRAVGAALTGYDHVRLIVNDDAEVALRSGADGLHVGQDDLPAAEARALLGPDRLLGVSVSSASELDALLTLPAGTVDLVGLSPLWATPTKPDTAPALGLDQVATLAATAREGGIRSVGIGGIGPARAAEAAATGVDGVCVVSAVCTAGDPGAAARELRREIARGRTGARS
ncbi:thiamine phosphate synthase [Blastococcus sp. TF02A-35]|uniref:thiamine phosphate synthase n=1 Tax=Blastococcus sp. TF02A-35 TaxID=2559612 RepID=UPI0010734050|nr:thiamine phosphate synthase [Blastococcus sp. TF02A_35]TFV51804.1 thiamine phosphate synthase [Blastococcus sp. TF02A_35]